MYLHYYYTGHCEYYTPKYVCMYLPAKTTKCITPHLSSRPLYTQVYINLYMQVTR